MNFISITILASLVTSAVSICPMQMSMSPMDIDMRAMHMNVHQGASHNHETITKSNNMGACTHCLQIAKRSAIKVTASAQNTEPAPIAVSIPYSEHGYSLMIAYQSPRTRDGPDINIAGDIKTIVLRV